MDKVEITGVQTVMDRLRESTHDQHNDAEGQDFQRSLGTGTVERESYIDYLGQLYYLHSNIGSLLEKHKSNKHIADVLKPWHKDVACIVKDLAHFGKKPEDMKMLAATGRINDYLAQQAEAHAETLLGGLYVLEGSTNGAKFLAKSIRSSLDLPENAGATYFDRYGEEQRPRWMQFKEEMIASNFDEAETERMVATARRMFNAFFEIGNELG